MNCQKWLIQSADYIFEESPGFFEVDVLLEDHGYGEELEAVFLFEDIEVRE